MSAFNQHQVIGSFASYQMNMHISQFSHKKSQNFTGFWVYRKFWEHVAPVTGNKNSVTIRVLAAMFHLLPACFNTLE
jgi:hypothetical protein